MIVQDTLKAQDIRQIVQEVAQEHLPSLEWGGVGWLNRYNCDLIFADQSANPPHSPRRISARIVDLHLILHRRPLDNTPIPRYRTGIVPVAAVPFRDEYPAF